MARQMTTAEERYIMHATNGDPLIASYLSNQVNSGQDFMRTAANLPLCEKCEAVALAHQQGYVCPRCGHRAEVRQGYKLKHHLNSRAWR